VGASKPHPRLWPFYHVLFGPERIELGVSEARRVVIEPATPAAVGVVERLTGDASPGAIAAQVGCSEVEVEAFVAALEAAGAIDTVRVVGTGRYDRHLLFYSLFTGDAPAVQRRLRQASVLLIGLGGLGCVIATQLVMAGVGALTLLDSDLVEESNLTRQFLYETADIGRPKVRVAARRLHALNAATIVSAIEGRFEIPPGEIETTALSSADLVILTGDTPVELARAVNDLCVARLTPWLMAGYAETIGVIGPLVVPGVTACLRCIESAHHNRLPWRRVPHFVSPSFGPLNGVVGSIATMEAIRFLTGYAPPISGGTRIEIDALSYATVTDRYGRSAACECCGRLGRAERGPR
jgi:molybdopterin/thiamine biosynthesis adenylyltransferase